MEVVLEGDVKEIVALLLELEVQRRFSFASETKCRLIDKPKSQPPVEPVKEAPKGRTDKFSHAILAHLFCPLSARKSST